MTFMENLKLIANNSPLIFCDSLDPSDVSLTRVLIFLLFWIIVICSIILIFFIPERLIEFQGYWNGAVASFTTLVTGNIAKKVFTKSGGTP